MSSRVLVICMCICIVGSSAVPASWLPCCCKAKAKAVHDGCSRSLHERGAASAAMADCRDLAAPCCLSEDTGARDGSLTPSCSSCRCLEQMRLVGATGGAGGSDTVQPITFKAQPVHRDVEALLPHHRRASYSSIPPLILKANLKTCSFLF